MAAEQNMPVPAFVQGFTRLPGGSRIGLIITVAALVAAVWAAVLWSNAPEYRVVFSNLSDRDGGAIVQALTQMDVPYKFSEGGGAILVPANHVHDVRLRLASQGLPRGGTVGFEVMENQKFGTTQFQEQVNFQRALEGELARSIQSLAAVQAARVHLAIPKPSVFLRETQKPSASVLVSLHPGRTLERGQIAGIMHLVSSSVPELPLKAVSVVDQNGTLLSGPSDGRPGAQLDPGQLAYAHQLETNYVRRIQEILEPVVGRSNIRAQVTADVDFSETEATAETYKPNATPQEATIRSQQSRESSTSTGQGAGGVPGALTNQPAPAATAPITGGAPAPAPNRPQQDVNTSKDMTVNYEVDKTVRHTRSPVGTVKRLSAAVVVNHRLVEAAPDPGAKGSKAKAAKAKLQAQPLSAEEMTQITALVKEAIGYSQQRGDTLNVVNIAFAGEAPLEPLPEPPFWKNPENVTMAKDLARGMGIAALLLIVLFGVLRPLMRQLAASAPPPKAPELIEGEVLAPNGAAAVSGYQVSLQSARQLAKQDPKVVAGVVRNWVAGNE